MTRLFTTKYLVPKLEVKVVKPTLPDQEIANLYCKSRGLPPSEREWVCQHSCAPETIPTCTDWNCEGTTITNRDDLAAVCHLVEKGELQLFDDMPVEVKLNLADDMRKKLEPLLQKQKINLKEEKRFFLANGSLLSFVKLTAQRLHPKISSEVRAVLKEIESRVSWQFHPVGPALFHQRFADLRKNKNERGNTLFFLAYDAQPHLIGWEAPRKRKWKLKKKPAEIILDKFGFGLFTEAKVGTKLTFTERGISSVPGDYYGPYLRLLFWVDQSVVDDVILLCQDCEKKPLADSPDASFTLLLKQITEKIGIPSPDLPLPPAKKEISFPQTQIFLLHLLLMQPLYSAPTCAI